MATINIPLPIYFYAFGFILLFIGMFYFKRRFLVVIGSVVIILNSIQVMNLGIGSVRNFTTDSLGLISVLFGSWSLLYSLIYKEEDR